MREREKNPGVYYSQGVLHLYIYTVDNAAGFFCSAFLEPRRTTQEEEVGGGINVIAERTRTRKEKGKQGEDHPAKSNERKAKGGGL